MAALSASVGCCRFSGRVRGGQHVTSTPERPVGPSVGWPVFEQHERVSSTKSSDAAAAARSSASGPAAWWGMVRWAGGGQPAYRYGRRRGRTGTAIVVEGGGRVDRAVRSSLWRRAVTVCSISSADGEAVPWVRDRRRPVPRRGQRAGAARSTGRRVRGAGRSGSPPRPRPPSTGRTARWPDRPVAVLEPGSPAYRGRTRSASARRSTHRGPVGCRSSWRCRSR